MPHTLRAVVGALIGGVLGHFLTGWLSKQGFYSVAFPGALMGFGALLGQVRGVWLPVFLGAVAVGLGYFTEWTHFPFRKDGGFGYFLQHLGELKPVTHLMVIVGAVIAFWIPFRRRVQRGGPPATPPESNR